MCGFLGGKGGIMEQEWLIGVEYGRAGKGGITDRSNKHLGALSIHDCRCDFKHIPIWKSLS